ncbi:MAG: heterodisulfide reductase subunit B [Rhodospirillales bacterium]|nr:heterodisulfide reductase subunit B [Rhodospirillales bacterium]
MRTGLPDRNPDRRRSDRALEAYRAPFGCQLGGPARPCVLGNRPRRGHGQRRQSSAARRQIRPRRARPRLPAMAAGQDQLRVGLRQGRLRFGRRAPRPSSFGETPMNRRYAYFPGCSAKGTCQELDVSTAAVANRFGIELSPLENPGCTGAREFRAISELVHLTANGRIIAKAERMGRDLVVVCDTCLLNLVEANAKLKADAEWRRAVNDALSAEGLEFKGTIAVKHFLWVLTDDLGPDVLRKNIVRPLRGLKVAPFYGCHIQRPVAAHGSRAEEKPALDRLCELLGATVVQYEGASRCCGFHVVAAEEKIALNMSGSHLGNAKDGGAHCVVTPCPLCHTVFDAYQPDIERAKNRSLGLPILHVSQMVGLAIGLSAEALALSRHVVECGDMLAHIPQASGAA